MALRHSIGGQLPTPRGLEELQRPVLMRPPVVVEFRPGADMKDVVAQLGQNSSVMLDAAVGSGKSTLFPKALAAATRSLVIHVVPNPLLALDLYNYVVKQVEANGEAAVPMVRWVDPDQEIPRTGLLYMSSADFISLVACRGVLPKAADVTVFLDEAHESDACTYLIRSLGLNLGMARLVQSSATFGPSGFRARETIGTLVEEKFDSAMTPDTWQIDDPKKPWHYGLIRDNLLVFIDSRKQAAALKQAYSDVGFLTYRLEAGMSEDEFITAMRALRDKKGPLVVLLADYSFRSGFTFDVGRVLDTGSVSYYDPTPGAVRKLSRPMCQFESVQAAGRAGRIRKGRVVYASPKAEYPAQICELEGVEREAAAYLSRCLGFKPLGVLASAVMSKESLPAGMDTAEALNSVYPLTYQVMDSHGRPRTPELDRCGSSASSASCDSDRVELVPPPKYVDDLDYKEFIASLDGEVSLPMAGEFLKVNGVAARENPSIKFPSGLRSVRNLVDSRDGMLNVRGLSVADKKYAISLVVNRYNLLNVEICSMDQVLRELAIDKTRLPADTRAEVVNVFEERGRLVAERDHLHGCLSILTHRQFDVRVIQPLDSLIDKRVQAYREAFAAPGGSDSDGDYARELAERDFMRERGHAAIDYGYQEHRRSSRRHRSYHRSREIEIDKSVERVIEFTLPARGLFGKPTHVELVSRGKDSRKWGLTT